MTSDTRNHRGRGIKFCLINIDNIILKSDSERCKARHYDNLFNNEVQFLAFNTHFDIQHLYNLGINLYHVFVEFATAIYYLYATPNNNLAIYFSNSEGKALNCFEYIKEMFIR